MEDSADDDAPECGAVSTTPTETPRRATKKAKRKTEAFLQNIVNTGDFDNENFDTHMAEDFTFHMLDVQRCSNRQEYIDYLRQVRAQFPNWVVTVLDLSVEIQEKNGKAKSWIMMKHTGNPDGCEREALNIWFWKRNEAGIWVCCNHYGFRGTAPLPLPLEAAVPEDEDQE